MMIQWLYDNKREILTKTIAAIVSAVVIYVLKDAYGLFSLENILFFLLSLFIAGYLSANYFVFILNNKYYKAYRNISFLLLLVVVVSICYLYDNKNLNIDRLQYLAFLLATLLLLTYLSGCVLKKNKCIGCEVEALNSTMDALKIECECHNKKINDDRNLLSVIESYNKDLLIWLGKIKHKHVITNKIKYVSCIDEKTDNNRAESLSHIAYFNLFYNNSCLHDLANYEINNNLPKDRDASFKYAIESFRIINDCKESFFWSINMIDPETWLNDTGSPYKSMQVDFYQRVTGIGITNKNRQVNAA